MDLQYLLLKCQVSPDQDENAPNFGYSGVNNMWYTLPSPIQHHPYRGISNTRSRMPLGAYSRPIPRVIGRCSVGVRVLVFEIPLWLGSSQPSYGRKGAGGRHPAMESILKVLAVTGFPLFTVRSHCALSLCF